MCLCVYIYIYFVCNTLLLKISVLGAMWSKEATAFFFFLPSVDVFPNFGNLRSHQESFAWLPGLAGVQAPFHAAAVCWQMLQAQRLSCSEPQPLASLHGSSSVLKLGDRFEKCVSQNKYLWLCSSQSEIQNLICRILIGQITLFRPPSCTFPGLDVSASSNFWKLRSLPTLQDCAARECLTPVGSFCEQGDLQDVQAFWDQAVPQSCGNQYLSVQLAKAVERGFCSGPAAGFSPIAIPQWQTQRFVAVAKHDYFNGETSICCFWAFSLI